MLMSVMGVTFLKRTRRVSRQIGIYLSKKIVKFAFSDCTARVSIQLWTNLRSSNIIVVCMQFANSLRIPAQVGRVGKEDACP